MISPIVPATDDRSHGGRLQQFRADLSLALEQPKLGAPPQRFALLQAQKNKSQIGSSVASPDAADPISRDPWPPNLLGVIEEVLETECRESELPEFQLLP